jgi:phage gp46-like protein
MEINAIKIENWQDIRELVLMSIGTDKGSWWADPDFGTELKKLRQEGKVTSRTAGTLHRMVLESVRWIIDDGFASDITCETEQVGKNEIAYTITVFRPSGKQFEIREVWNAV